MKKSSDELKKKILIISFSYLASDPRVLRQYKSLKDLHNVYTCGFDDEFDSKGHLKIVNKTSVSLKTVLASMRILKMQSMSEIISNKFKYKLSGSELPEEFDLIIANDINSVPFTFNHFKSKKHIIDLHEHTTTEIDDRSFRKFVQKEYLEYLCRKYLPKASSVTSVNETISRKIQDEFRVKVYTINNAPFYADLSPSNVDENNVRIMHHGAAIRSRKIELMIEAAKYLDKRFTLELMLIPNEEDYMNYLRKYADGLNNVKFIPPVKYEDIVSFCNSYDIGIFILPPVNENYEFALPNKFFEFIQSRLAVVTGPSPEMKSLINEFDLGIVTETFDPKEAAEKINKLSSPDITRFKKNSDSAAKVLSFENNKELFMKLVNQALN